jgi:hypothetical protein
MRRLLREPLLHFFILGALLFGLYGWLHGGLVKAPNEITVSRAQLDNMQAQFDRVWQRPPTTDEINGLVESWVREEILYREGLAMGFDRDDPVVRRRIGQKVAFLAEGPAPAAPTTAELQAWLDSHTDTYAIEATYTLRQVYFDPSRHGDQLKKDMDSARLALDRGQPFDGDATMLPPELEQVRAVEVAQTFGKEFESTLRTLPVGSWQGPVRSGFGFHLVELRAREGGRPATLEEVRAAVERDLLHARTEEANEAFYQKLRANYAVRIDAAGSATSGPAG